MRQVDSVVEASPLGEEWQHELVLARSQRSAAPLDAVAEEMRLVIGTAVDS